LKNTPSIEQLQAQRRLFASFTRDYPDLLQHYVDLVSVAVTAEDIVRGLNNNRYKDAMLASTKLSSAASAAAFTAYRAASDAGHASYRQAKQAARDKLNADITAANEVFQAAEKIARQGVNERFAAIDVRFAGMTMTAVELCNSELSARAAEEHQQARNALIAEITDALAPARAVYDQRMAELHTQFQKDTLALDNEQTAFDAPYVATRTRLIDDDKARHAQVGADAYMRRYHSENALDHLLIKMQRERLEQVELFLNTGDRSTFLRYLDSARRDLDDYVASAQAEEVA